MAVRSMGTILASCRFRPLAFESGAEWASNDTSSERAYRESVTIGWDAKSKSFAEKVKAISGVLGQVPKLKPAATAVGIFTDLYSKFWPFGDTVTVSKQYRLFKKAYRMGMVNPMPPSLPTEAEMARYRWKTLRRQLYKVKLYADDLYGKEGYLGQCIGSDYDIASFDERQLYQALAVDGS